MSKYDRRDSFKNEIIEESKVAELSVGDLGSEILP